MENKATIQPTFTKDELEKCFKTLSALKSRAYEIAPLCTNISSREDITGMWWDEDPHKPMVDINVWSSDCGCDGYSIPFEYFSMTLDEIEKAEAKKRELEKIRIRKAEEREKRRKKRERAARERRQYERLKKKFG